MRTIFLHTTCISALAVAAVWTAPALAQSADSDGGDTAEIVVTAQKRTEKLQDIPVAAAVLSSAAVEQAHVTDLSDINRVVPSVEIKGTFNGRVPYGLRGISTNANEGAIGLTSGVSIQVDGVPVPADSFAANTISDVAQLEVLKGPQATLGGRTASAGVINFVTNGPSDILKGAMTATVTEDGEYRGEARISGPLGDTAGFSLSAYGSHTPYPVENLNRKEKSKADSYGVRGKLKFDLSDNFDATLMGHYALSKSQGGNFTPQYFTPGAALFPFIPSEFNGPFGSPSFFGIRQSDAFPGYTIAYGNTKYASPVDMKSRYEDIDGSLALNLRSGGLTFSSLTSYFKENQFQTQDVFLSNVFFFDVLTGGFAPHFGDFQQMNGKVTQLTQEFKVVSDPSDPVNFIAGLFYSDMTVDQVGLREWVANPISKRNISDTKNYSAYARVTAKLAEKVSVVAGLRYNHDKIGWNVAQTFNPPAGQFQNCNPNFDGAAGTGIPAGCAWNLSASSGTLVGDVALQFRPSDDMMVYASYSRGYKPQAYNTVHDFASNQTGAILFPGATAAEITKANAAYQADLTFAKPTKRESIDSFEIGLKSSFLDRHLTFNLAAFYTKYNDYQAQIFDNSAVIGVLALANAGARTMGLEADINYVKDNTRVSLSAAYIDAKFTSFPGATCFPTQTVAQGCTIKLDSGGIPVFQADGTPAFIQNLSGKPLPASPKFKFNASIEQTVPLSGFNLILGSNLSARSSTLFQANGNPQTRQPGFALLDASIGFQTKDERATLTLFVNNITDHFYLTNAEDFFSGATGFGPPGPGFVGGNYVIGQPARDAHRYFGGRLSVKF